MLHNVLDVETDLYEVLDNLDPKLADKFTWLLDEALYGNYDGDYEDGEPDPSLSGFAPVRTPVYDEEDYEDDGVNWNQPVRPAWTPPPVRPAVQPRPPVRRPEPVDELRSGPTGFAAPSRYPSDGW